MHVLWIDKPTIEKWTIDDARRLRGLGNHDVPITRFGEIQKTQQKKNTCFHLFSYTSMSENDELGAPAEGMTRARRGVVRK